MKFTKKLLLLLLLLSSNFLLQAQRAKEMYENSLELYNNGFPSQSLDSLKQLLQNKRIKNDLNKKGLADCYRLAAKSALLTGDTKRFEEYSYFSLDPQPVYIQYTSKNELIEYRNFIEQYDYLPKWTIGVNAQLNKYILKVQESFGDNIAKTGVSLNYMANASYWFSRRFGIETNGYIRSDDKDFSYMLNLEMIYRKPIQKFQLVAGLGWGIARISSKKMNEWNCAFPFTKYYDYNDYPSGEGHVYSDNNDIIMGGKIGLNYSLISERKYSELLINLSISFYSSMYYNSFTQAGWDKALRYNMVMSPNQKNAFVYAYPQYLMINLGVIKPFHYKVFKKK